MTVEEKNLSSQFAEEDQKKLKSLKIAYPASQFGGGIEKAYFGTYASYLYTNVYMMSAAFSGILTLIQTIIGWIGGPLFGTILDRISFKNAKYYPWLIIGPILYYAGWIAIYCLPALGVGGAGAGIVALIIASFNACVSPLATIPSSAVYPLLSTDPKDRQYFARMQKIARDGGKTLFGYIFPALLIAFTAAFGGEGTGEPMSYALCALIAGVPAILFFIYYALTLKGSYVERKAVAANRTATGQKKKNIPLSLVLKTVFTNRALLSMFLFMGIHKSYYFLYVTSATYMFRYVWGDFSKMGIFMTVFNLTAIIGVMFGPLWKKIFKETKRCFVSCMLVHVILLAILAVFFKSLSAVSFTIIFGASSFFMGMLENYIMPMFAAASDYGAWKSGNRLDGITMSIYSLTIKTGTLVATTIRTAILVSANLDAVTAGGAVTAEFTSKLSLLFSWIPLGLGIVALLVLMFLFNLNDDRIKKINDDLSAGLTAATSSNKF